MTRTIRFALFPSLALGLLLLAAPAAWAEASCCAEDATSPEDQAKFESIFKQSEPALNRLMEQIWTRQGELRGLMNAAKPDAARIEALTKDIGELRAKLMEERATLRDKLAQAGFQMGRGAGPGYGRGYGPCPMSQQSAGPDCCAPAPGKDVAKDQAPPAK